MESFWRPRPTREPSMPLRQTLLATSTCSLPHESPKQCIQTSALSHRAAHTHTHAHTHTRTHTHTTQRPRQLMPWSPCVCVEQQRPSSSRAAASPVRITQTSPNCANCVREKGRTSVPAPTTNRTSATQGLSSEWGPLLLFSLMLGKLKNRE